MNETGMLIIATVGPSLICLVPLVLFPIARLRRAEASRQFQYNESFAVRHGGSTERMTAESSPDRRFPDEWYSQGSRGVKRAWRYVELWDPVPRAVVDEHLRRIGADAPRWCATMRTRRHPRFDERAADGSRKAEPAHGRRPYRRFAGSPLHVDIASQTQSLDLVRGVDAGCPSCLR